MRKKDIENKIANQYRVLELLHLYEEEFTIKMGGKRYKEIIDAALDELIFWRIELKKMEDENEKNN